MGGPIARRRPFVFFYSSLLNINVLRTQTRSRFLFSVYTGSPGFCKAYLCQKSSFPAIVTDDAITVSTGAGAVPNIVKTNPSGWRAV
jgi:hypothetical protein